MTGNGNQSAKTFMEKLVKSLQVKLIMAGFSQLWYAVSSYASVVAASLLETAAAISSALYRSSSPLVCRPAETLLVCIWYAKEVHSRFEYQVGHPGRSWSKNDPRVFFILLNHVLRTLNEAFFHQNPNFLSLGRQFCGISGIFIQFISIQFGIVQGRRNVF